MSEANATCNVPPGFGVPASPLWPAMAKRLGRVVSAIVPATNVLRFIGSSLLRANAAVHVHPGERCRTKKGAHRLLPGEIIQWRLVLQRLLSVYQRRPGMSSQRSRCGHIYWDVDAITLQR